MRYSKDKAICKTCGITTPQSYAKQWEITLVRREMALIIAAILLASIATARLDGKICVVSLAEKRILGQFGHPGYSDKPVFVTRTKCANAAKVSADQPKIWAV